jgi:hypothetical protein
MKEIDEQKEQENIMREIMKKEMIGKIETMIKENNRKVISSLKRMITEEEDDFF